MEGGSDTTLADALDAVRRELELTADDLDWLELRLGAPRSGRSAPAYEAQALDLVLQQLHGLSTFVEGLARACDPAWRAPAAKAAEPLTLAAQRARLGGGPATEPAPTGELELL